MISIFLEKFHLFQYIMIVVTCCYIGFSFARVDGIIASYNISHSESITYSDLCYLMYQLSEDAAPYIAEMEKFRLEGYDISFAESGGQYEEDGYMEQELINYFWNIENKEDSARKWNYSQWRAKKAAEEYLNEM